MRPPRLSWLKIKNKIAGTENVLTLVFADNKLSHMLNNQYRGKNKPTNVLAFPYSENSGEIFLNLSQIKDEASSFGRNYRQHTAYLFIHAILHLKGFEHGSKMEGEEKKAMKLLGF